jgi:hypothetical protein
MVRHAYSIMWVGGLGGGGGGGGGGHCAWPHIYQFCFTQGHCVDHQCRLFTQKCAVSCFQLCG